MKQGKTRLNILDALRGIAALGVVLYHYTTVYVSKFGFPGSTIVFLDSSANVGRYGVELFFIISGFVISMSIEKTDDIKLFAISRFSRLFPTFWFAVLFTSVFVFISRGQFDLSQFIANLTMVPNLLGYKNIDGSYWTLLYELVFYFLIGLIFSLKKSISIKYLFLYFLLSVTTLLIVIFTGFILPYKLKVFILFPHFQLFLAGFIFYKLWCTKQNKTKQNKTKQNQTKQKLRI